MTNIIVSYEMQNVLNKCLLGDPNIASLQLHLFHYTCIILNSIKYLFLNVPSYKQSNAIQISSYSLCWYEYILEILTIGYVL